MEPEAVPAVSVEELVDGLVVEELPDADGLVVEELPEADGLVVDELPKDDEELPADELGEPISR